MPSGRRVELVGGEHGDCGHSRGLERRQDGDDGKVMMMRSRSCPALESMSPLAFPSPSPSPPAHQWHLVDHAPALFPPPLPLQASFPAMPTHDITGTGQTDTSTPLLTTCVMADSTSADGRRRSRSMSPSLRHDSQPDLLPPSSPPPPMPLLDGAMQRSRTETADHHVFLRQRRVGGVRVSSRQQERERLLWSQRLMLSPFVDGPLYGTASALSHVHEASVLMPGGRRRRGKRMLAFDKAVRDRQIRREGYIGIHLCGYMCVGMCRPEVPFGDSAAGEAASLCCVQRVCKPPRRRTAATAHWRTHVSRVPGVL